MPHRAQQAALLEILRFQQRLWEDRQRLYGGSETASILRVVQIGWLERKPYDQSSIAMAARISRTVVMRRLDELEDLGWVQQVRDKNRIVVQPTAALLNYMLPRTGKWVRKHEQLVTYIHKLLALEGPLPITDEPDLVLVPAKRKTEVA